MRPHESLHYFDIKDVGPEAPQQAPEVLFDPRRDIHPEDITMLRHSHDQERLSGDVSQYHLAMITLALSRIDPTFDLHHTGAPEDITVIRWGLKKYATYSELYTLARLSKTLATLDPTFNPQKELSPAVLGAMRNVMIEYRGFNWMPRFFQLASDLRHLDPTFDVKEEITEADYGGVREYLHKWRQEKKYSNFAATAHALYDIDPNFNIAEEITPADRKEMMMALQKERDQPTDYRGDKFAEIANGMYDLTQDLKGASSLLNTSPNGRPLPIVKTY